MVQDDRTAMNDEELDPNTTDTTGMSDERADMQESMDKQDADKDVDDTML